MGALARVLHLSPPCDGCTGALLIAGGAPVVEAPQRPLDLPLPSTERRRTQGGEPQEVAGEDLLGRPGVALAEQDEEAPGRERGVGVLGPEHAPAELEDLLLEPARLHGV